MWPSVEISARTAIWLGCSIFDINISTHWVTITQFFDISASIYSMWFLVEMRFGRNHHAVSFSNLISIPLTFLIWPWYYDIGIEWALVPPTLCKIVYHITQGHINMTNCELMGYIHRINNNIIVKRNSTPRQRHWTYMLIWYLFWY